MNIFKYPNNLPIEKKLEVFVNVYNTCLKNQNRKVITRIDNINTSIKVIKTSQYEYELRDRVSCLNNIYCPKLFSAESPETIQDIEVQYYLKSSVFTSPEESIGKVSRSSDSWRLGILLYFLITKDYPNIHKGEKKVFEHYSAEVNHISDLCLRFKLLFLFKILYKQNYIYRPEIQDLCYFIRHLQ